MSVLDGPGEGTWSVFATKVVEERDALREEVEKLTRERDNAHQEIGALRYSTGGSNMTIKPGPRAAVTIQVLHEYEQTAFAVAELSHIADARFVDTICTKLRHDAVVERDRLIEKLAEMQQYILRNGTAESSAQGPQL